MPALFVLGVALAALQVATGWIEPYGLFRDELYYWACGQHPGLGYVDHPPLAPWLLAGTQALFGDGHLSFAIIPGLCAIGTVMLTGRLAQCFGADRYGQSLAGLAVAISPIMLVFFSFYSVNAIELLVWSAASVILVERIRSGDQRWWLAFGAVSGIALLNKHTFLLLPAGLALGVLASPLRADLRSRWLWLGAAMAFVIALPNVLWNAANGWPSLAFYAARGDNLIAAGVGDAIELQILGMHPLNVLLWLPGTCWLLFSSRARAYRPLGIGFAALLVMILFSGDLRGDRISGVYPIALAAGATVWSSWHPRWQTAMRAVLAVLLLGTGVALMPATLPLLSPSGVRAYWEAIGETPEVESNDVGKGLPLFLAGRLDLERFAGGVLDAWRALPETERERTVLLTSHWVTASTFEYYARNDPHPPVVSPHNAYYFWQVDLTGRDLVMTVDIGEEILAKYFERTRAHATLECEYCVDFPEALPVFISSGPKRPLPELIESWRDFGIQPVAALRGDSFLSGRPR